MKRFTNLDWQRNAACRGHDLEQFFPEKSRTDTAREAKAICAECPVRKACLEYAVTNCIDDGIWGGRSERERQKIRRKLRRGVA